MKNRIKPKEGEERGLKHAKMSDKLGALGSNEGDAYDVEGAVVVDSEYDAGTLLAYKRKGTPAETKTFFATDAPRKEEDEPKGKPMFQARGSRPALGEKAGPGAPA